MKECPACHRWVGVREDANGRKVWAIHKPGAGKRRNCRMSAEPYKGK